MNKEIIFTNNAPKPIGPYSQAVKQGNLLFISGQLPNSPDTGEIVWHDVLTGKFPFSKEEEVALPVTELKLEVVYYITKNISIGGGGFYSIWWNAPVAPKWSVPGDWVVGEGTGWRLQGRTLKFSGLKIVLSICF